MTLKGPHFDILKLTLDFDGVSRKLFYGFQRVETKWMNVWGKLLGSLDLCSIFLQLV